MELDDTYQFSSDKNIIDTPFQSPEVIDGNTQKSKESVKENIDAVITDLVSEWFPESEYISLVDDPNTGKTHKVVDIERLKNEIKIERRFKGVRVSRDKIARVLFEKYKNDTVLSPNQLRQGDYQPKPLFYYPSSIDEATNVISLSDADFHIALWDLDINSVMRARGSIYPTQDGEGISAFEARFALKVFHRNYGDGRRDTLDGKLYLKNPNYDVDDPASPKRVPFSRDVLNSYGLYKIIQQESSGEKKEYRSMYEGLEAECPHLLLNGAIVREDVRQFTISREGELNKEFNQKVVGKNAYVMLRGVNQYVGRRFAGCSVEPFGEEGALVFSVDENGRKSLRAIFTIIDKSNVSDVYVGNNGNEIPRANADKTSLKEINYDALLPKSDIGLQKELRSQKRTELVNHVTEVVTQLIDSARQSESLVRSEMSDADKQEQAVSRVRSELLNQAERAIYVATTTKNANELEEELDRYSFDARAYVAIMQSIGVEKMLSRPLDRINAINLADSDKETMRRLLRDNYEKAYPGEANKEFREKVASGLEASFNRDSTEFYVLRNGEKIVSFNRFDKNPNEQNRHHNFYFGSFNADPNYRGVGGMMLEHTIKEKLKICDAMQAHCDPISDISKKYIEDGFIATNTETVAGKFSFEIWRSRDSSDYLQTKQMSIPELVELAGLTMSLEDDFFVREVEPNDNFFELDSGLSFLLTRYFTVGGKTYAAFELNTRLSRQFGSDDSIGTEGQSGELVSTEEIQKAA